MTRLELVRRDARRADRQRHGPVVPDRGRDRRPAPGARVRPVPRRPGARLRARVARRARAPRSASARRAGSTATSRLTRDDVLGARRFDDADRPVRRADRGPSRRRRTRAGRYLPDGARSASRTARCSSATPPTCSSPAAASPPRTTPTPRSARWPSAWPWARRPARPRPCAAAGGRDPRDVDRGRTARPAARATARSSSSTPRVATVPARDVRPDGPRRHRPARARASPTPTSTSSSTAGGRSLMEPDFDLGDVDADGDRGRARPPRLGLGAVVDAMPCDAGRNAAKLAELSRRTGVHVVAPTGLHHDRYYGPAHWSHRPRRRRARRAVRRRHRRRASMPTTTPGRSCAGPTTGPASSRSPGPTAACPRATSASSRRPRQAHARHRRADPDPLRARDRRPRAGPAAGRRAASEPGTSSLSHVDKVVDRGYHRELLGDRRLRASTTARSAGATSRNGTLQLLDWMAEDGLLDQVVLGMDAARQGYYAVYGGRPGSPGCSTGSRRRWRRTAWAPRSSGDCSWTTRRARVRVRAAGDQGGGERMTDRLLTSVVGSHARPRWFVAGIAAAERGEFGPADLAEMLDDAVDLALRDQEAAGIDVVSDGEMRRAGFFTAEFYRHLTGVRRAPAERRLGAGGHDQQHRFAVLEPIAAPDGLGVVAEYRYAATRATRPLKVTIPGPYTLSGRLRPARARSTASATPRPRRSCRSCAPRSRRSWTPGATFIQIDEPSPAIHPDAPADFAALFNAAVAPVVGRGPARRPPVLRQLPGPAAGRDGPYRPVLDAMLGFARRRARPRVRQPGDGRGRDPRRDRRRRPGRRARASSTSRTTTSSRPTRSPSGSTRCSPPASRPSG